LILIFLLGAVFGSLLFLVGQAGPAGPLLFGLLASAAALLCAICSSWFLGVFRF
jgi:hypothetical protein